MCVCVRERERELQTLVTRHTRQVPRESRVACNLLGNRQAKSRRERKGLRERGHRETGLREGAIKGRLNAKQTNVEFGPSARNSISDSKGKARGECRVGAWQLLISRLNLKLSANLFMRR